MPMDAGLKAVSKLDVEQLYREGFERVVGFVQRSGHSREIAQELAQEIFVRAWRFQADFDETCPPWPWLWRITRNVLIDWSRTQPRWPDEELFESSVATQEADPEDWAVERERLHARLRLLHSTLTRGQKRVLWLRLVHGMSFQEIAEALGMSLSAVKNLVMRAKG